MKGQKLNSPNHELLSVSHRQELGDHDHEEFLAEKLGLLFSSRPFIN